MADSLTYPLATPRSSGRLRALLHLPRLWIRRANWRKELMNLDAQQMRDCGLDPTEVRREATKPFWRG